VVGGSGKTSGVRRQSEVSVGTEKAKVEGQDGSCVMGKRQWKRVLLLLVFTRITEKSKSLRGNPRTERAETLSGTEAGRDVKTHLRERETSLGGEKVNETGLSRGDQTGRCLS